MPYLEQNFHGSLRGLVGQIWADTLTQECNLGHHIGTLSQRIVVAILGWPGRPFLLYIERE